MLLAATGLLSLVVFPPATANGQVDKAPKPSTAQTIVLNPQQIVISITNELSRGPTSFERAVKEIQDQIEKRREVELDKASTGGAFWRARFWAYLPHGSGSLNSPITDKSDDDPFFTPQHLTLSYRILDRQLAESDARSRIFFGR